MTNEKTMNPTVHSLSARMSLRDPLRESLTILAEVADLLPMEKIPAESRAAELDALREIIASQYPTVADFERDFPSLCFALATGVGKTRLMGAFIAYLYLEKSVRNFFVLAPSLTIYNKLIQDFTPGTKKYVFTGVSQFAAQPPILITGDDYEGGRGVRALFDDRTPYINIFNISKINTETRAGATPRIKRLSEYIGASYFSYLSGLPDLTLLMDESHRYRASAGMRAINELNPILGLELTATPQIEKGQNKTAPFKNVIYSFPLPAAMDKGYVKAPTVATRENFNPAQYDEKRLERLKLEDGVRLHETTKAELQAYARQYDLPPVKPFILVVAIDTDHANELNALLQQEDFAGGAYAGKVITVHSNQSGQERDEVVERLVAVENPDEPTEIVIHVNLLKEGWDVNNLFTIIPLRRFSSSKTLIEQTVGRGLRLPYGKRTGVAAVDRLTIVAHDRFEDIIAEANNPNSLIRKGIVIGRDIPEAGKVAITLEPRLLSDLTTDAVSVTDPTPNTQHPTPTLPFVTPAEKKIALITVRDVLPTLERLSSSAALRAPDIQAEIVREVKEKFVTDQGPQIELTGVAETPDFAQVVKDAVELHIERTIDIPTIFLVPTGETESGFYDFDLDPSSVRLMPIEGHILLYDLKAGTKTVLDDDGEEAPLISRLEDILVHRLSDFPDIAYGQDADLLYKLAGQMIAHLRSYLKTESDVQNVTEYHARALTEFIHAQMQPHRWRKAAGYTVKISKGFRALRTGGGTKDNGETIRDVRHTIPNRRDIRGMVFGNFQRCLYATQKFQSDGERRFAFLLEADQQPLKWFKPSPGQFPLTYHGDKSYEPDFVVETETAKYLCEPKSDDELNDPKVQAKSAAAIQWCKHATSHEQSQNGKPWTYLLIPDSRLTASATLAGLVASCAR